MIGIYCIKHIDSNKRYIGKSINIEKRIVYRKHYLSRPTRYFKGTNRHLYNAVQKYGWDSFEISILETFEHVDEELIAQRELYWMMFYGTFDRKCGYNLRYDSSTGMIVHEETRAIQSINFTGSGNPNHGNKWSESAKERMSEIKKTQHAEGKIYGDSYRKKKGLTSAKFWKENPDKVAIMAKKVAEKKKKYNFLQLTDDGTVIKEWLSIEEIVKENPNYKWQNIYSVCNGYKKRIYGYQWQKVLKHED